MAKRKWGSKKQRAAFRKMRRALAAKRRGKKGKKRARKRGRGPAPTKRRRKTMAKKKRRGGKRRGGGGSARIATGKEKGYIAAGAAVYGYASRHIEMMKSVPVFDGIGAPASHGLIMHFLAGQFSGEVRRWLDLTSVGALAVAGYNLGVSKGDVKAAAAMKGIEGDHRDEVMGELEDGDDDADDMGDDDDADDLGSEDDDDDADAIDDEMYDEAA